jgi:hypothetical protein
VCSVFVGRVLYSRVCFVLRRVCSVFVGRVLYSRVCFVLRRVVYSGFDCPVFDGVMVYSGMECLVLRKVVLRKVVLRMVGDPKVVFVLQPLNGNTVAKVVVRVLGKSRR